MSDSWICWNPRIDEPSNISPSVNTLSSNALDRDGEVLHGAGQVAEPDVDELDPLVGYVPQDLITAAEHQLSLAASASLARIVCRPVPRARL